MRLFEFLRTQTNARELCVIREDGWIVASCWIDYEDLFHIPNRLANKTIKRDEWNYIPIVNENNEAIRIPCHYVDV